MSVTKQAQRERKTLTYTSISQEPSDLDGSARIHPGLLSRARVLTLLAILVVGLIKQFVMVDATLPFQGHDEVAHLGYFRVINQDHRLPTLSDTLPAVLSPYAKFTLDWPALYTPNHPPQP